MREWEIGAVENIHGALPYIRFAPILALVGVGVNRIGKQGGWLWHTKHQENQTAKGSRWCSFAICFPTKIRPANGLSPRLAGRPLLPALRQYPHP